MPESQYENGRRKRKRRVLNKIQLEEISVVTAPAQEGAVAVLLKQRDDRKRNRDSEEDEDDDVKKRRMYLTGETDGHTHTITVGDSELFHMGGITSFVDDHSHPFVINDDGSVTIGAVFDHSHEITIPGDAMMMKSRKVLMSQRDNNHAAISGGMEANSMSTNKAATDQAAELAKRIDDLTARLDHAERYGALSDVAKAHYDALPDADKAGFLAKSADEQSAIVNDAAEVEKSNDPVLYKAADGAEYRASDGAATIALAKRLDEQEKQIRKRDELLEKARLTKRAEEELKYFSGTTDERVALLKGVDRLPVNERDQVLNILKAANDALAKNFTPTGVNPNTGDSDASPTERLDTLAKARATEKGIDYYEAYNQIGQEQPQLLAEAMGV